jgi:hypothetical protein
MVMNFDEIKNSLLTLTQQQLTELSARIGALRQLKPHQPDILANDTSTMLIQCLQDALLRLGCPAPFYMFKNATTTESYREKIKTIDVFLSDPDLTKQERYAILRLSADLLCRDLRNNNVGLIPGTLCRCVHRIPMLINQAFPGYQQAGLLRMLIKREQ